MTASFDVVRAALLGQWGRLAGYIGLLDPAAPTRVAGWTNAEVIAHLTGQPALLARFLAGPDPGQADFSLATNLSGIRDFADIIDRAAREAAIAGRLDFAGAVARVLPALSGAAPDRIVVGLRGPISLDDYLRTRCVEAVVHGLDLNPPLDPDPAALDVAASALCAVLVERAPGPVGAALLAAARRRPARSWVEIATGRAPVPAEFVGVVPLLG